LQACLKQASESCRPRSMLVVSVADKGKKLKPTPTPSLRGAGSRKSGWRVGWLSSSRRLVQSSAQKLSASLHKWSGAHTMPVAGELLQQSAHEQPR